MDNTYVIHGELYSSKNSRQTVPIRQSSGKIKLVPLKSKVARKDERDLTVRLREEPFHSGISKEITEKGFPVVMTFMIYRKTKRRFDYINIVQNVLDCMVKVGILPDDDANHVIPAFEPYDVDKDDPRVEISIRPSMS